VGVSMGCAHNGFGKGFDNLCPMPVSVSNLPHLDVLSTLKSRASGLGRLTLPGASCFNALCGHVCPSYRRSTGVWRLRPSGGDDTTSLEQDVAGCVVIAVVRCRTRRTSTHGRAAAWGRPAIRSRADLRGRDGPARFGEGAAIQSRLVLEHADERRPSRVVHRLGEPGAPETGHRKVFHEHRLVLANDLCGCLVMPVPTPVRHSRVLACHLDAGLGPVLRSLGLPGQLRLKVLELLLRPAQEAWTVDLRPIGQDRESGQAQVDTGLRLQSGKDVRLGVHNEAEEVPAATVFNDSQGRRRGRERTRPPALRWPIFATYTVPSSFREKALVFRRIDCRVSFFDLYRGGPTLRPCPFTRNRIEEILLGGVQVPQSLLQDNRRHISEPGTFLGALGLGNAQ